MKIFLFSIVLIFTINFQSNAQCTNYGYYIEATGFICKGSKGSICINTRFEWACQDGAYEIQLSFPTGSYNFATNGAFTVLSITNQITTLHAPISPPTQGLHSVCVEGILLQPGTIFKVEIVKIGNPPTILNPANFTLDGANVIGSNVGINTMSQAIAAGLVLDPTVSSTTGQRIIIDGTLQINKDYTFGSQFSGISNEIKMEPGSSIEVLDGFVLQTFRTNISACTNQWNKIQVNGNGTYNCFSTTIKDAQVAIELKDMSNLYFASSKLNNNDIGIGSFGSTLKTINFNIVPGNSILGNVSSISNGKSGIHMESVSPITINGYFVIKDMSSAGIYLSKTDLTVDNVFFNSCAIGVQAANQSDLLHISNCRFEDGNYGVAAIDVLELQIVDNNKFINTKYGVFKLTNVANDHTIIENNEFDFTNLYDVIGFAQPSKAEIQSNIMYATISNVYLLGFGAGFHTWVVNKNNEMYGEQYNAEMYSMRNAKFIRNVNPLSANSNVLISNGRFNKVISNKGCSSFEENIHVKASPFTVITCNELSGMNGIVIENNCNYSRIIGNSMSSGTENLVYGSSQNTFAHTGKQLYRGNMFDNSGKKIIKAINYSDESVAEQNQYKVGLSAGQQGSALYPFFTSDFDKWFIKDDGGSDASCPPGFAEFPDEKDELESAIDGSIKLLESGLEKSYGKEVVFDAKLKLLRDLTDLINSNAKLNSAHEKWYQLLKDSDMSSFINFENTYRTHTLLTESQDALLTSLSESIKSITPKINKIDPYIFDEATGTLIVNNDKLTQFKYLILERDNFAAQINDILLPKHEVLIKNLPLLKKILDAMPDNELASYQNLRKANYLFLNRLSPTFKGFNESEIQALQSISNQCASIGGEGVYLARNLLAESTFEFKRYADDCLPSTIAVERTKVLAEKRIDINVSPNPASTNVKISFQASQYPRQIQISDIYGKKIMTKMIDSGINEMPLNVSSILEGVYFVQLSGSNQVAKFIVVR